MRIIRMSPWARANPNRTASSFPDPLCLSEFAPAPGAGVHCHFNGLVSVVGRVPFYENKFRPPAHFRDPFQDLVYISGFVSSRDNNRN